MVNFIVCEFNPFHNGHAYLLRKAAPHPNVCIMSSHVTQRGDFAFTDKWTRAKMALLCGADLVLELSAPFAMGNASLFAKGATEIARATGLEGRFCFGTEGDVSEALAQLAQISDQQLSPTIKGLQRKGYSYAAALAEAYQQIDPAAKEVLSTPNNVLALEYMRAGSDFTFYAIPRQGAAHDAKMAMGQYCSASALRENIGLFAEYTPQQIHSLYNKILKEGIFPDARKKDLIWLHKLRQLSPAQWDEIAPDGIGRRFYKAMQSAAEVEQGLAQVKTKCCTYASLRRLAMKAFLGVPPTDTPAYIRVLGANRIGREVLSAMSPTLPIVNKPAAAKELGDRAAALMEYESRLTDHFSFMLTTSRQTGTEYLNSPIIIE